MTGVRQRLSGLSERWKSLRPTTRRVLTLGAVFALGGLLFMVGMPDRKPRTLGKSSGDAYEFHNPDLAAEVLTESLQAKIAVQSSQIAEMNRRMEQLEQERRRTNASTPKPQAPAPASVDKTILMDEIGKMLHPLQLCLLRSLFSSPRLPSLLVHLLRKRKARKSRHRPKIRDRPSRTALSHPRHEVWECFPGRRRRRRWRQRTARPPPRSNPGWAELREKRMMTPLVFTSLPAHSLRFSSSRDWMRPQGPKPKVRHPLFYFASRIWLGSPTR